MPGGGDRMDWSIEAKRGASRSLGSMARSAGAVLLLLVCHDPAAAQGAGWRFTVSGGAMNGVQSCPPDATGLSCDTNPTWGTLLTQASLGYRVTPALTIGIEGTGQRFDSVVEPEVRFARLTTYTAQLTATAFPLTTLPLFVQAGAGGGRYRLLDRNGQGGYRANGTLWAASAAVGIEWPLAGVLHAGPYLRLDYVELAEARLLFRRLQQRLLTLGIVIAVK